MKKKKIISSLMLAGVVLSSVSPIVANAENVSVQEQVPSSALTQEVSKDATKIPNQVGESSTPQSSNATESSTEASSQVATAEASAKENVTEVSTFEELKSAFESTTPLTVHLKNNIVMTSALDGTEVKNPDLTIDGSDGNGGRYTIDFGEYYIDSIGTPNCHLTIQNLNTVGGSKAWGYGVISYNTGGTITARNVSHKGIEFLLASDGVTLGGDVDIEISEDAPTSNAISVWGTATNLAQSNLTVEDNANINIKQMGVGPFWGTVYLENASSFVVGKNAVFNVDLNPDSLIGDTAVIAAPTDHKLAIDIKSGAKVKASTNASNVPAFKGFLASLNVEKGASFDAISYDKPALELLGGETTLSLSGAFDINTTEGVANPIESVGHTTSLNFDNTPVNVWSLQDLDDTPTKAFGPISGSVNVFGTTATQVDTNDSTFNSEFAPDSYHRISSKGKQDTKPVINATDKVVKVGDTFDALAGVTATDNEDGDLTSSITVKTTDVDVTKAGTYHVTYSVTDSDGNITEKTITVTVKSDTKPVISATDKAIKVGDTFDALAGVTATDNEDGDLTSSIIVKTTDVDVTKAGTYHVTYSVTDSDGNITENTITVTVKSDTKPVISATDKAIKLGDTFDALAGVTATDNEDGDLTSSITVKTTDVDVTKAGTYHVTYSVTDSDGNITEKTITVTVEDDAQGIITPAVYNISTDRSITGTYEGDVAKIQIEVNGTKLPAGGTVSNGTFKYYTGVNITKTTDEVFVIAFDKAGKQLDRKQVTITENVTTGKITPAVLDIAKDRSITGTYEGDVAKIQIEVNGSKLPAGGTVSNGTFKYYEGVSITKTTDEVFVIAFDKAGKQLDRKQVKIINSETSGKINPTPLNISTDRSITGTYEGDVAKIQIEVNGSKLPAGGTVSNGTFKYYEGGQITKTTDRVFVIAFDKAGKQLDRKQVTITENVTTGTITPAVFNLAAGRSITGTYEGDVAKIQIEVNGSKLPAGGSVSKGSLKYYVGTQITKTTDKVYVFAYDKNNKELDKKLVTIVAE